jgi:hypothetical protein
MNLSLKERNKLLINAMVNNWMNEPTGGPTGLRVYQKAGIPQPDVSTPKGCLRLNLDKLLTIPAFFKAVGSALNSDE